MDEKRSHRILGSSHPPLMAISSASAKLRGVRTNGSIGGAKSISTRTRVAAAQAVLSIVLLLVVYLTLLRPDSEGDLLAVKARQGTEFTVEGVFPVSRDARGGSADQREAGADANPPASVPAPEGLGTAPADDLTEPPPPSSIEPPADGRDPDSPTGDQYGDTVSHLLGRLETPD